MARRCFAARLEASSSARCALAAHVQDKDIPLISMAVKGGDKATVAALIEAGADVNARDAVRPAVCMLR